MSDDVLRAIERRDMFAVFRSWFNSVDLPTSQGWIKTKDLLTSQLRDPRTATAASGLLYEAYIDNLLYTQKAVSIWPIADRDLLNTVATALSLLPDVNSPYAITFPLPVDELTLEGITSLGVPTGIFQDENGPALVFAGKRWINREVALETDNLEDSVLVAHRGLYEVTGKERVSYPVFDVVVINLRRGIVEIRVDNVKYLNEVDIFQIRTAIKEKFNNLIRSAVGVEHMLGDPLNLYPAIRPLYEGEGWKVRSIEHANDGGYLNKNRGRRRLADVRQDDYHSNGEDGVGGDIHIHSLTACWDLNYGSPQLIIHGHSKILSSSHPHIDYVKVLDCWNEGSYNTLLDSLVDSLRA